MKNLLKITFKENMVPVKALAFLSLLIAFQACKKTEDNQTKPLSIVGKWVWSTTHYNEFIDGIAQPETIDSNPGYSNNSYIQFNSDGTGMDAVYSGNPYFLQGSFNYSKSGNNLTFYIGDKAWKDVLTTFTQTVLTIRNVDTSSVGTTHYKFVTDYYYSKQ